MTRWLSWCVLSLGVSGCLAAGVGDPCAPEVEPPGGLREREVYVETSSAQCATRTCIVATPVSESGSVESSTYCSRRCADDGDCPSPFQCVPLLEVGAVGVRGSYCVR